MMYLYLKKLCINTYYTIRVEFQSCPLETNFIQSIQKPQGEKKKGLLSVHWIKKFRYLVKNC